MKILYVMDTGRCKTVWVLAVWWLLVGWNYDALKKVWFYVILTSDFYKHKSVNLNMMLYAKKTTYQLLNNKFNNLSESAVMVVCVVYMLYQLCNDLSISFRFKLKTFLHLLIQRQHIKIIIQHSSLKSSNIPDKVSKIFLNLAWNTE